MRQTGQLRLNGENKAHVTLRQDGARPRGEMCGLHPSLHIKRLRSGPCPRDSDLTGLQQGLANAFKAPQMILMFSQGWEPGNQPQQCVMGLGEAQGGRILDLCGKEVLKESSTQEAPNKYQVDWSID